MTNNKYKVFFSLSFISKIDKKKKISKSFESDLDINNSLLKCYLTDKNIHKKWLEYILNAPVKELNPPFNFNNQLCNEKKIIKHSIIDLIIFTELHKISSA